MIYAGSALLFAVLIPHESFGQVSADLSDKYAFCGDCWCIPDEGEECPMDTIPSTEYSDSLVQNLQGLTLENPILLDCNPYDDTTCETVPPLESGTVCAAKVNNLSEGQECPQDGSYRLQTFDSVENAELNGFTVTHEGACGACSSFQDLSIYMTKSDLAEAGTQCAFRAIVDTQDGILCYEEIGFSPPCASIWLYNTANTATTICLNPCLQHASSGLPNNAAAPGCELVECIQCDEDISGPIFQRFAGRTRRRSGLLSQIVRPCSVMPSIQHVDPCPEVEEASPTVAPTTTDGGGSGATRTMIAEGTHQSLARACLLLVGALFLLEL